MKYFIGHSISIDISEYVVVKANDQKDAKQKLKEYFEKGWINVEPLIFGEEKEHPDIALVTEYW